MTLVLFGFQEMVTVGVDGSVLDRIAKLMSYLRLGLSGKVLKKKKKEKDAKGACICLFFPELEVESFNWQEKGFRRIFLFNLA